MTKEVYSVKITLQVTDKMFRNPFLIPMDTLYALIAKLGFIAELWDFPTLNDNANSRSKEQTSDFEEEGNDMVAEEGGE